MKDSLSDATAPGTLSKEQQAHLLFGPDDATMALANLSYAGSTPGYEANSLENNYFIRTGDILEWSDPIADLILLKLNQKEASSKVKATNAARPQPTYRNPINDLVACGTDARGAPTTRRLMRSCTSAMLTTASTWRPSRCCRTCRRWRAG